MATNNDSYDELEIRLNLSASEFEQYYRGTINQVQTLARDGRTVRFPAKILRPFLTHDGVRGVFVIRYDSNRKFVDIRRQK